MNPLFEMEFNMNFKGRTNFFHPQPRENILEVASMIQRLVPDARVAIGHGQMEGNKLEKPYYVSLKENTIF